MAAWAPLVGAEPAANGTAGRWLTEASDLVATDAEARVAMWSADRLPLRFPVEWPAAFKSEALKRLLNKSMLKGTRCRAVPPASAAERAAAGEVALLALHSFANAERVAAATGWGVAKGFLVLELADAPPSTSFVAMRHWWNVSSAGGWIDLTPPFAPGSCESAADGQRLLVESVLGEKEAAPLTAASRTFACALAARLAAGQVASPPPSAPPAVPGARKQPSVAAAPSAPAAHSKPTSKPPSSGGATSGALNYSKWDALDVSDEEEDEERKRNAAAARQAAGQRRQDEELTAAFKAQQESVSSAMDAAVAATAAGNFEALDEMAAAARAAAPLSPEMEELIASLPLAAQLAARAAAANAAANAADATAGGGGGECSLREMLGGTSLGGDADDPELEDPREFFHNDAVAEAAAEQRATRAAELRARAEAAVAASAKKVEVGHRVEWLGDWS